jgi:hypothetical protein
MQSTYKQSSSVFATVVRSMISFALSPASAQTLHRHAMFALVAYLVVTAHPASAHGPSQPPHQLYKTGDLTLESGETIRDFSISYVTMGP